MVIAFLSSLSEFSDVAVLRQWCKAKTWVNLSCSFSDHHQFGIILKNQMCWRGLGEPRGGGERENNIFHQKNCDPGFLIQFNISFFTFCF